MPRTEEEKMDYMGMLDKLASEYPELEDSAMMLSGEIEDIMPMDEEEGMMEEEDMMMGEEEFAPIPAELEEDEMEEEEDEFEL